MGWRCFLLVLTLAMLRRGTPQKPFGAETGKTVTVVLRGYVLNTEDPRDFQKHPQAQEWRNLIKNPRLQIHQTHRYTCICAHLYRYMRVYIPQSGMIPIKGRLDNVAEAEPRSRLMKRVPKPGSKYQGSDSRVVLGYVCTFVCVFVCIYRYRCIYIYVYTYMYMYIYMRTHTYRHMYTSIYIIEGTHCGLD